MPTIRHRWEATGGTDPLFAAVGITHIDGAFQYGAPVRALAKILRHPFEERRGVRTLRKPDARDVYVSPIFGLYTDPACLQAYRKFVPCMFHVGLLLWVLLRPQQGQ